jgi:hypothetical protein
MSFVASASCRCTWAGSPCHKELPKLLVKTHEKRGRRRRRPKGGSRLEDRGTNKADWGEVSSVKSEVSSKEEAGRPGRLYKQTQSPAAKPPPLFQHSRREPSCETKPIAEGVSSAKCQVSSEQGPPGVLRLPTSHFQPETAAKPRQTKPICPPAGTIPHHFSIPSFQHFHPMPAVQTNPISTTMPIRRSALPGAFCAKQSQRAVVGSQ